jgi:hypothetical protein
MDARRLLLAAGLVMLAMFPGCASSVAPRGVDLHRAAIVEAADDPAALKGGPSGAGIGAGRGMLVGVGAGTIAGVGLCAATGPWFPLCMLVIVPTTTVVGTASGAAIGAMSAESREDSAMKKTLLSEAAATVSFQHLLIGHVQEEARLRSSVELPVVDAGASSAIGIAAADGAPPLWLIEIALDEVSPNSDAPDRAYGYWVGARVELHRSGTVGAVFKTSYGLDTEVSMTATAWREGGADATQKAVDGSLRQLAKQIVDGLVRKPAAQLDQKGS